MIFFLLSSSTDYFKIKIDEKTFSSFSQLVCLTCSFIFELVIKNVNTVHHNTILPSTLKYGKKKERKNNQKEKLLDMDD